MLKDLFDKELDFNGQLKKSWVVREPDMKTTDIVQDSIRTVQASLLVVSCLSSGCSCLFCSCRVCVVLI